MKPEDLIVDNYYIDIDRGVCQYKRETIDPYTFKYNWVFKYKIGGMYYEYDSVVNSIREYDGDPNNIQLNRYTGKEWRKAKQKAKEEAQKTAKELVSIASKRKQMKGFCFSKDTEQQKQFEDAFPYQTTSGQIHALNDIKEDMESEKVMNRIIVGDVSCGKTEVAMRVAFKAVQDNKQVAVLAPSVLLAKQHYADFTERFKGFNINIGFLSSNTTAKQKRELLQDVEEGKIQILIGTHSVVGDKVKYKDIGLLICDEEHKFGKMCKNSLMKLKPNIDYLSMTATPIPQSYFKLSIGLIDVSIIDTFPNDREPIDTKAIQWNDETIKEYINRELNRQGQIFIIENNVEGLGILKDRLLGLIPELKIGIVHGKMRPKDSAIVMDDFRNKKYDVLIATSVIEVGITVKNANTIILYNAQSFGLQQAHQIRGRVGRGDRKGYCLLVTEEKSLNSIAQKRLQALEDNTELGCGIKLSEIDCKLRGEGDLVGIKQSGKKYRKIGYRLYNEILQQAIKEEKNIQKEVI